MSNIKTIEKENIRFLMDVDYNNVYGRIKYLLREEISFFADVRIKQNDVTWFVPDGDTFLSLSEADENILPSLKNLLNNKIDTIRTKISQDSLLESHVDDILTYPSDDFVYFKGDNDNFQLVLAGWGCTLAGSETSPNTTQMTEEEDHIDNEEETAPISEEPKTAHKVETTEESTTTDAGTQSVSNNMEPAEEPVEEVIESIPMTFSRAISTCFEKYATFTGRATRSEYWYFFLFNFLVNIAFFIIMYVAAYNGNSSFVTIVYVLSIIYSLATILPGLAVSIRRLHDSCHSGWWVLINLFFICYIGPIWFIVLMCKDTYEAENEYGPVPDEYYA